MTRRWFRFSLRTLLVMVAALGASLGWLAWQVQAISARQQCRAWIEGHDGIVKAYRGACDYQPDYEPLPVVRRWLGDQPGREIWLSDKTTDAEAKQVTKLFPEALVLRGDDILQVPDECLARQSG